MSSIGQVKRPDPAPAAARATTPGAVYSLAATGSTYVAGTTSPSFHSAKEKVTRTLPEPTSAGTRTEPPYS